MKFDQGIVFKLLIEFETSDLGDGLKFSDHEFIRRKNYNDDVREQLLSFRNLDRTTKYHLEKMVRQGYLDEFEATREWTRYSITPLGHEALEHFRENTFSKKAIRVIAAWMNKAMTSIFLPIAVSVLTVLTLQLFGLN